MSRIYLFRGMIATGKTMIANLLGDRLGIPVYRKEDIYHAIAIPAFDHQKKNDMAYSALLKTVQAAIDEKRDFVVDIGLAHWPKFEWFITQLNLQRARLYRFVCVCSDEEIWRERVEASLLSHQEDVHFHSAEEAIYHYRNKDSAPREGEYVLDSVEPAEQLLKKVLCIIEHKTAP